MYFFFVVSRLRRLGNDRAFSLVSSAQKLPQKRDVVIGGAATAAENERDRNKEGAANVAAVAATTLLMARHCSRLRR